MNKVFSDVGGEDECIEDIDGKANRKKTTREIKT
jgi:hypothetical protein